MHGRTIPPEFKLQQPLARALVVRGELPFAGRLAGQVVEISARSGIFKPIAHDVAGSINSHPHGHFHAAVNSLAGALRDSRNLLVNHCGGTIGGPLPVLLEGSRSRVRHGRLRCRRWRGRGRL